MFSIGPGVTAAVENLSFTGHFFHPTVQAVLNQGTFAATNVTFTDLNWALLNVGGTATLKRCTIQLTGDLDSSIGAIFMRDGHLTIDQSALINNPFGAIYSNLGGSIDIKNTLFQANEAFLTHASGALTATGDVTIKNSAFLENHSPSVGGAISNGGTMTIENSILSGNQTGFAASGLSLSGGGAIFNAGTLTIKNSEISGNQADARSVPPSPGQLYGGGLFNAGTAIIVNSTISENQVGHICCAGLGGGIYDGNNGASLTVRNSRITSNTAFGTGGGIFVDKGSLPPTLIHAKVVNNTPNDIVP
jgi:hypothetical protein